MIQVRDTLLAHKGLSWVFITQGRKQEIKCDTVPVLISILPVLTYIHISSPPPLCLLSHILGLRLPWPLPLCPSSSVSPSVYVRTYLYFMFKCSPLGLLLCFGSVTVFSPCLFYLNGSSFFNCLWIRMSWNLHPLRGCRCARCPGAPGYLSTAHHSWAAVLNSWEG